MEKDTGKEFIFSIMEIYIMVNGKMIKVMEEVLIIIKEAIFMKGNGKIILLKEKEYIFIIMEIFMMETM